MKKNDWQDIDVNSRKTDKVYFESNLIQNISDSIDFLKDEATEILKDLDSAEFKQKMDEFNLEEFSQETVKQIDDIFDEMSQFKDQLIDHDELPEDLKEFSKNTKAYLNRDDIYLKKAKRKLEKESSYRANVRAVELCDKAIVLDGLSPEAYYIKGRALINLKQYEDAIEEFINALAIDDSCLNARLGIADANRLNGDFDDAIDVYNSVLNVDSSSYDALKGKALTYFELGDYRKSNDLFIMADDIESLDKKSKAVWDLCLERM